jgi:hypothetical protein
MGVRKKTLRKNGLSLSTLRRCFCNTDKSAFSKTFFLVYSSCIMENRANEKKRIGPPTQNNANNTFEIKIKQETPRQITRSGVYFNNHEILDTRHPAQVEYNTFFATEVPDLPIGIPLAKPPRLGLPTTFEIKTKQETPRQITKSGAYFNNHEILDTRHPVQVEYKFEIKTKQETSRQITRSGVYFNNHEILDTRHPAQVEYNTFFASEVPDLPIGIPLAKPPRLGLQTTFEIKTKQETPRQITKSGVYLKNQEILDTRHPAQVEHNFFFVTEMPYLPIGIPLAKPPPLNLLKHSVIPFVSNPASKKDISTKINKSSSRPEKKSPHTRKRAMMEKGSEGDRKIERRPSKDAWHNKENILISNKKLLSEEECFFLEAASLLSVSKVSTSSTSGKQKKFFSLRNKLCHRYRINNPCLKASR